MKVEQKRVAGRFVRQGLDGEGGVKPTQKESAGTKVTKAPRPKSCRKFTRARMAEALPEIVGRFVEEAKKGSIAHTKLLADLGGLDDGTTPVANKRRGKSVVARLLESLSKQPDLQK